MSAKRKEYCILATIILLQIAVIIYWSGQKENYFIDEFLSMGYARGYAGIEDTPSHIPDALEWQYNTWIKNADLKKYLVADKNLALWKMPFGKFVKSVFKQGTYFGILNLAESLGGKAEVSQIPALIVNIICFVVAELFLWNLFTKLKMQTFSKTLAICMFGFSGYFISLVEYVRFYMYVVMLFTIMLNLLYILWNSEKLRTIILSELGIFALGYLGFLNSEFMLVCLAFVSVTFVVAFAYTKKIKQLVSYLAFGAVGGIYVLFRLSYIWKSDNALTSNIDKYFSVDFSDNIKLYLDFLKDELGSSVFGHKSILPILFAAITLCMIWRLFNDKKVITDGTFYASGYAIISLAVWLSLFVLCIYLNRGIYVCALGIIQITWELFYGKIDSERVAQDYDRIYVKSLIWSLPLYLFFTSIVANWVFRYYCFSVVIIDVALWFFVDRLINKESFAFTKKGWQVILTGAVATICVIPFFTRNLYYIYEDDAEFTETICEHFEKDVVLLCLDEGIYYQDVYDCVNMMPDDTSICPIDGNSLKLDKEIQKGEFLLWCNSRDDATVALETLKNSGYITESLGSNHASQAFLCRRNSE